MAEPVMVKCKCCHNEIERDTAYNPSPKMYYCNVECFQKKQQEKNKKKKKKVVDKDYEELMEILTNIYGSKMNNGVMGRQIRLLKDNYNFTCRGMILTLDYYQTILKKNINTNYFSFYGIIEGCYIDAKNYWLEKQKIKKAIEEYGFDDKTKKVKVVERSRNLKDKLKVEEF